MIKHSLPNDKVIEIIKGAKEILADGYCKGMSARSTRETYITCYHSEATYFSLPAAIERACYDLYKENRSEYKEYYEFKCTRLKIYRLCFQALAKRGTRLSKTVTVSDYNSVKYPGRTLISGTSFSQLEEVVYSMNEGVSISPDQMDCLEVLLQDFNDKEGITSRTLRKVLDEAIDIVQSEESEGAENYE